MFNIYRTLFWALKQVRIVKLTPPKVPNTQKKKSPGKISHPTPLKGEGIPPPFNHTWKIPILRFIFIWLHLILIWSAFVCFFHLLIAILNNSFCNKLVFLYFCLQLRGVKKVHDQRGNYKKFYDWGGWQISGWGGGWVQFWGGYFWWGRVSTPLYAMSLWRNKK